MHRVYQIGFTHYFYQEYIEDKESLLFKHEPYFTTDHIYKKLPLIENWCKLHGLKYSNEQPELIITKRIRDFVKMKYQRQKPIMLMQTNGGLLQGQQLPYSWTRDMPKDLVQAIANQFSQKYHILQICRSEFNRVDGAEGIYEPMSNLELFALLYLSEKRLFIDSCMQHAATALDLPSTVLWIGSPSDVFGYKMHTNFQAKAPLNKPKLPNSFLFDYNFEGSIHDYPYGVDEKLFDLQKIVESLT